MYISIKEIKQMVTFYFKALDFLKLKYSWFTVLCEFQLYSNVIQFYYIYYFFRLFSTIGY